MRDMTSFRADRLIACVISQEGGENSEKRYDMPFIAVLPSIFLISHANPRLVI